MRTQALLACAWSLLCHAAAVLAAADTDLGALEERALQQAAALAAPSLVRIHTVGGLERLPGVPTGTGPTTGLIVSRDGYIITSAFKFASQPASILVELPDRRRFPARLIASDRVRMLVLLQIDADDLTPAQAAAKEAIQVGQWGLALGRTYEIDVPNVSVGIVSALNRIWGRAIQTDAKVSPANYGGALVDIEGRVLGVLVPLSPDGQDATAGVEWYDSGIGFAIPLEDVLAVLPRLKQGEDLRPGLLGGTFRDRDLLAGRAIIGSVRFGSPAEQAGWQPGDEIVEVDGRKIARQAELKYALGTRYAGDEVSIAVRRGEQIVRHRLKLAAELPPYEPAFLGILPVRDGGKAARLGGVGIRYVFADSPAQRGGLQPGDRVLRFGEAPVSSSAELADAIAGLRPGVSAELTVRRDGRESSLEVKLARVPQEIPAELPPAPEDLEAHRPAGQPAPLRTGRFTETLPEGDLPFWAYVPQGCQPEVPHGLMVWLHPAGDPMQAEMYRQWKAICDRRGIILVAPQAQQLDGWQPHEAALIAALVEHIAGVYPIDRRRVFLHGYADGGHFAWHVLFKHPELFRGAAVAAAALNTPPREQTPETRLQLHVICGERDAEFSRVAATVELLRKLKYAVSFRRVPQAGRAYPPPPAVEELERWSDALDRI